MNINEFSKQYVIRTLETKDIPVIFELFKNNPLYFKHCPPEPSYENIEEDLKALPPNKTYEDKYYVGYYLNDELICVMDLIDKYPNDETVFIGFFMIKKEYQGKGIGKKIIDELIEYLTDIGYHEVRLGYSKENPQSKAFWEKNGFVPTGVVAKRELYDVVVMHRLLNK